MVTFEESNQYLNESMFRTWLDYSMKMLDLVCGNKSQQTGRTVDEVAALGKVKDLSQNR